jgi:hypothetical protein
LERQKAAKAAQTALSARHAQHQAAQLNYGVSTIDEEIKELKKQQRRCVVGTYGGVLVVA